MTIVGTPGSRGGTVGSLERAVELHAKHRADESRFVQRIILTLALEHGEFHSEMLVGMELEQPNVIGTATNVLLRRGLIEKGGHEERRISSPTSRRASDVYRLTDMGAHAAKLQKA